MDAAAPHLGYVLASYGLSALVLAALALWVIARDRRMRGRAAAAAERKRP